MRFITALLLIASYSYAQVQYAEQTIKAYPSSNATKYQGKVLPTTKIEVLKKENGKALVKIIGWTKGDIKRVLYYSKGKRIISAAFSKKAKFSLEKLKVEKIDGKKWEQVSITTWVDKKGFTASIDDLYKKASDMYQSNCTICHPAPDIEHFTANQWPEITKDMGPKTPLTKNETMVLTQYLQKHTDH